MIKCNSFEEYTSPIYEQGIIAGAETEYRCMGTKERELCTCGGDRCKCDQYPEIKAKALKEEKDKKMKKDIEKVKQEAYKELADSLIGIGTADGAYDYVSVWDIVETLKKLSSPIAEDDDVWDNLSKEIS